MMPVTIELDEETAAVLQRLASSQNRPELEVVRDALSVYAQQVPRALPKGVGKYHSGQNDVASKAREVLRDAAKEGQWP
jgi:hypothetical protein